MSSNDKQNVTVAECDSMEPYATVRGMFVAAVITKGPLQKPLGQILNKTVTPDTPGEGAVTPHPSAS